MRKKGFGTSVIVLVIILGTFISLALGWSAHTRTVRNKVMRIEDLSAMVQAHALADNLKEHYINQSLLYASWQSSYELGKVGGIKGEWKEGALPDQNKIESYLAKRISDSRYFGSFDSSQCNVSFRKPYSLTFTKPYNNNSYEFFAEKNPIEITCSKKGATVKYYLNVSRIINSTGNRYFYLYQSCYNLSNLTGFYLNKIQDPSGYYYGIFALPVKGLKEQSDTLSAECSSDVTDPAGIVIKKLSYLVAQIIAEMDYRAKLVSAYEKSKQQLGIVDGTQTDLENEVALALPNFGQEAFSTVFPGLAEKIGELRGGIKTMLNNVENSLDEIMANVSKSKLANVTKDFKKYLNKSILTLKNVQGILNQTNKTAQSTIDSFNFVDTGATIRNQLKNNITKVLEGFSYSDFVSSLKNNLTIETMKYENQTTTAIINPINSLIDSLNIKLPGKSASASTTSFKSTEVSKTELKKQLDTLIDNLNLTALSNQYTEKIKSQIQEKTGQVINNTIRAQINKTIQNLTKTLSNNINHNIKNVFKNETRKLIAQKIKEPIQQQIRNSVISTINSTINSAMDQIYSQIDKGIDEQIQNILGTDTININYGNLIGKIGKNCKIPDDFNIDADLEKNVSKNIRNKLKEGIKGMIEPLVDQLKKATGDAVLNNLNDTINSLTANFEDNLFENLDAQIDSITNSLVSALQGPINDSLNSFVDKLESSINEEINTFVNQTVEQINPVLQNFDGKIALFRPLLKKAVELAVDETYSGSAATETIPIEILGAANLDYELKSNIEQFKKQLKQNIKNKIEETIHQNLFGPVLMQINNFEPIDPKKVDDFKSNLLQITDSVFKETEIFNDVSALKEKIEIQINLNYDNIQTTLNNLISSLSNTIETLDVITPITDTLESMKKVISDNIEKLIKILEGNNPFVFHFFGHKVVLDITIPIPTPGGIVDVRAIITKVRIDPEDSYHNISVTDQKFVLPVSEGYKHQKFVCDYHHIFEGTKDNPLPKS